MSDQADPARIPGLDIGEVKRQRTSVSADQLVRWSQLLPDRSLIGLVEPVQRGVDLIGWADHHRERIERELLLRGALLFRGFDVPSLNKFDQFMKATTKGELLEYAYASTPRSKVSGRIYTSTEYPADQSIPLHNELSYSRTWPMKIWFYCATPAAQGGETPLADSRAVFRRIHSHVRARFHEKQIRYVRNYGGSLDLSWQQVFQSESRNEVESFCRRAGIELEWLADQRLRTSQTCQSQAQHPVTGELVWFNQAHLFHVSMLSGESREMLLSEFDEHELPRNAYHGDGTSIDDGDLAIVRQAYQQETVSFPWQRGDILLLDNMLTAHGREPFTGERRILVGMAEPHHGSGS